FSNHGIAHHHLLIRCILDKYKKVYHECKKKPLAILIEPYSRYFIMRRIQFMHQKCRPIIYYEFHSFNIIEEWNEFHSLNIIEEWNEFHSLNIIEPMAL